MAILNYHSTFPYLNNGAIKINLYIVNRLLAHNTRRYDIERGEYPVKEGSFIC